MRYACRTAASGRQRTMASGLRLMHTGGIIGIAGLCLVLQYIDKSPRKPLVLLNGFAYLFKKIYQTILTNKVRADIS